MSKKKARESQLEHATVVLQSLLQTSKSPLSEQFIRWRLWNSWSEVVGNEISAHSMPVGFLNGMLYVWVNNSVRMQEMTFLVKQIRQKINTHLGRNYVRSIRFTLDRKTVPTPQESAEDLRGFLSKQSPSEDGEPQPDR